MDRSVFVVFTNDKFMSSVGLIAKLKQNSIMNEKKCVIKYLKIKHVKY